MIHGQLFLSKVIDRQRPGGTQALQHHGCRHADRSRAEGVAVYRRVRRTESRAGSVSRDGCGGSCRSSAIYTMPNVDANFEYSAKQIKSHAAKQHIAEFINGKFGNMYENEKDGNKLLEDLHFGSRTY